MHSTVYALEEDRLGIVASKVDVVYLQKCLELWHTEFASSECAHAPLHRHCHVLWCLTVNHFAFFLCLISSACCFLDCSAFVLPAQDDGVRGVAVGISLLPAGDDLVPPSALLL